MVMRWFTEEAFANGGEDGWDQRIAAYQAHLAAIAPILPPSLAALATSPRMHLHDGQIERLTVDLDANSVAMVIYLEDSEIGNRRIAMTFEEARIVPENLQLLADAIGAEFRSNHWHAHRTVTVIRAQEVDVLPHNRFTLRLGLWPFYGFAIEFDELAIADVPKHVERSERSGEFILKSHGPAHT